MRHALNYGREELGCGGFKNNSLLNPKQIKVDRMEAYDDISNEEIFAMFGELMDQYVMISYFSFMLPKQGRRYRFYFKDINTNYLHNPMIEIKGTDKKEYPHYESFAEGAMDIIHAAHEYLDTPKAG